VTMLQGKMQSWSMTVDRFIQHAARWHGTREVVSYLDDGVTERTDYASILRRALKLSSALLAYGIKPGDRVATLAMNSAAHLVAWYAIAGIGAVCHTLNPRLGQHHLAWIVNHAQDRILIADGAFSDIAEMLSRECPSLEKLLLFTAPHSPNAAELVDDFCASAEDDCEWGQFDENAAAGMCYTSGTTGDPKGVLYSHRSNVLHTLMTVQPDAFNLSERDTILPVVPMYHANAWGLTFSAPAVGAKLVLPGSKLDGETLFTRMRDEGVTFSAGVPTAWIGLLDYIETKKERLPDLSRVLVGGAAMTEALRRRFEAKGIEAIASWGMTELSPVGGISTLVSGIEAMPSEQQLPYRLKQGRVFFGIDMRVCDENGTEMAHDGVKPGALQMRGPCVAAGYYGLENSALNTEGFLDTGDIATIDPFGYVQIVDRAKDIVKSGGEWISSLEIENAATLFPAVGLAAVIGVPHPKWDERPLLLVTALVADGIDLDKLRDHLADKLPRWWLPEEIRIVESLPLGATGKIDKKVLRSQLLG
jgi:acyl-CoA synthetase (AMP-forming)/AMP-acid ligase II